MDKAGCKELLKSVWRKPNEKRSKAAVRHDIWSVTKAYAVLDVTLLTSPNLEHDQERKVEGLAAFLFVLRLDSFPKRLTLGQSAAGASAGTFGSGRPKDEYAELRCRIVMQRRFHRTRPRVVCD